MPLVNEKTNQMLTCSTNCIIKNSTSAGTFTITNKKNICPGSKIINSR